MPPNDDATPPTHPPRSPRRSLGRGPGARPVTADVAAVREPQPEPAPAPAPAEERPPGRAPGPEGDPEGQDAAGGEGEGVLSVDAEPEATEPAEALKPAGAEEPAEAPAPAPIEMPESAEAPEPAQQVRPVPLPRTSAPPPEGDRLPAVPEAPRPIEAETAATPAGPAATPEVGGPGAGGSDGPQHAGEHPPGTSPRHAPGPENTARPEDSTGRFTVRLVNFEGPFDLLLQLISKHKLDVTEVALSKVTDEFMAYIRAMGPDWDLDQTTEFLVVAATLLDLKAARLLPAAEVEDEADLALLEARDLLFARLLQYRAYKQIAEIFSERLAAEARRYPRTVGLEPHHAELLPEVVISIGAEGFAKLAVKAMQPKAKPQVYVDHIHAPLVSVREQADLVIARLRDAGEVSFHSLIEDAPDTLTVVARFLALLELYRERAVVLDQEEALGSLMVRWTGAAGQQPMVTDEFDQEAQPQAEQKEKV
ncbi:segregation/condensation protein A [Streptomyces sp. NPDC004647]|uniref:segregation/condensation protein A n=1 Tax=Streptomyces sp. NPDC004647 TaxID=3154671 RepID=UPI0033A2E92B